MPSGGARQGAGRPKNSSEPLEACRAPHVVVEPVWTEVQPRGVVEATQQTATLLEVAIGQSSVKLEMDSKGQVKPTVHVYHRSPAQASATAEEHMDRLLLKYQSKAA